MVVAFHAWNPFQVFQATEVAKAYRDSVLLLERRKSVDFDRVFDQAILRNPGVPIVETTAKEILDSDGDYAAIVCQTPFRYFEKLKQTKRAALQFSLTKEWHQYGAWRAMCDLNLVYGEYSRQRVQPLSPCRAIGNPQFEPWFTGALDPQKLAKMKASLDPSKRTVLYLPTWDPSSIPMYQGAIAELASHYNLIAKVHHNTDALELERKTALGGAGLGEIFGASDDSLYLLACADLVLSDYSGAMFDAINVGKPVVLLQREPENLGRDKFGLEAIEYARRDEIGPVAGHPDELAEVVADAFARPGRFAESNRRLKEECFALETGCAQAGAEALDDLVNGRIEARPFYQIYFRDELIAAKKAEVEVSKLERRARDLGAGVSSVRGRVERKLIAGLARSVSLLPFRLLYRVIPASLLVEASKALLSSGNAAGMDIARIAAERGSGTAIGHLTTLAGREGNSTDLSNVQRIYDRLPARDKARHARHAARFSEALGSTDLSRKYISEAREFLVREIRSSASMEQRYLLLQALVRQRSLETAEALAGTVVEKVHRETILKEVSVVKSRMGKWYPLVEIANRSSDDGTVWCMVGDSAKRLDEVPGIPVVEFLIPTYFADVVSGSNPKAHDRICAFLRAMLDEFSDRGFAIVPKHQYWLNIGCPSGRWPTVSYHTTGGLACWLHVKDSAIPGYFRFDDRGYAGFSSMADLVSLPPDATDADPAAVQASWSLVQDTIVGAKASKYEQVTEQADLPERPYVFFPLQLLSDTVSSLAWLPMLDALQTVVDECERSGRTVVVKRHPLCKRADVAAALDRIARSPAVYITSASIHDILPTASLVVTVNSGVGFEALLYGKRVITVGAAEYGVVTEQCKTREQLAAALSTQKNVDLARIKQFVHHYLVYSVPHDNPSKIADWVLARQSRSGANPSRAA